MAKWRNLQVTYKVEKVEQGHMPLFLAQCIVGHLVTEGEGFWDGVSIHFMYKQNYFITKYYLDIIEYSLGS